MIPRATMRRSAFFPGDRMLIARRRPTGHFREMGELGLLGLTLPEEYGGAGPGMSPYGLVAREVERVDSAIAQ